MRGKKFGKGFIWTHDEKAMLREYLLANPAACATDRFIPAELASLFPDRSHLSITSAFRKMRRKHGFPCPIHKRKEVTAKSPKKTDFLKALSVFVEDFFKPELIVRENKKLRDENAMLQTEIGDLKDMLRKLTRVRAAVEEFQKVL